ncbi:hypothetical protein MNB_SV-13-472 [hydrothermal vent metagenome]|uniref:Uncharacterized protein n=1 Tax=hydrothermal vent metagenome TaxID=652676 RepID=A0A1W1CZT2_9ZZZZ
MPKTLSIKTLSWGIFLLIFTLSSSLASYYFYSHFLRGFSLFLMFLSLGLLLFSMFQDMSQTIKSKYLSLSILVLFLLLYFSQRIVFHRFDFMVGDASDYFAAGICAVNFSQDIGYILPLSASFTAIGYDIFGIDYALLPYVIFYASTLPLFYLLFRHLKISILLSLIMSLFILSLPLSIWYAKSSFSETLWQILLIVFIFNSYQLLQKSQLSILQLFTLFIIIAIAPLLRVEGIFFYALLLFIILYHFWKFKNILSSFILSLGFFILAFSIHISLILRPSYLLERQYSRILPHATEASVMTYIYALSVFLILFIGFIYLFKKYYKNLPFPLLFILLSLASKIAIAGIYSEKKSLPFMDMLFFNEYSFALGNFGFIVSILIYMGIILLYIKAYKGEDLALLLILLYSVFTLPLAMQNVTFSDPHAFLFYWNRYYFAIIMLIHLFALTLVFQMLQQKLSILKHSNILFSLILIILLSTSINPKLQKIVITEAHLQGSQNFYTWVQKHTGQQALSLVTQSGIIYKQNARPDGQESIEYLIGRTFSLYKMPIKSHLRIAPQQLSTYIYPIKDLKTKYILCVAQSPCKLTNPKLQKVSAFIQTMQWREHFGLYPHAEKTHKNKIENSVIQERKLYASLYKRVKSPPQ